MERHPIDSTIPTREGECESRHGVESDVDFPVDSEPLPLSGGRPVRDVTDLPATSLLQLETRPIGRSDGRFSPALEFGERPPWNLIGRVLTKVESQEAELIPLAPIWPSQPWYPKLLSLLVSHPLRIEPSQLTVSQSEDQPELISPLAVWPISGNTTQSKNIHRRLQTSYCCHGDRKPPSHTILSVKNGSAGVLNSNVIQFQDL